MCESSITTRGAERTRVLITHGDADEVLPREIVHNTVSVLQEEGSRVELSTFEMKEHAMLGGPSGEAETRTLMTFWSDVLSVAPSALAKSPDAVPQTATSHLLAAG